MTSPTRGTPAGIPGSRIVRLASVLVPDIHRDDWVEEWEGELAYAWEHPATPASPRRRLGLLVRALGALPDALEMRRDLRGDPMLGHDLRIALRRLVRRPGFSTLVVVTLALGIAATTAVFTVAYGVLLRPLAFAHADRVVELSVRRTLTDEYGGPYIGSSVLDEWQGQTAIFDAVARHGSQSLVLEAAEPRELRAVRVSSNFFSTLGVTPRLGRTFAPSEGAEGNRVAVISDELWRTALGADPAPLGRTLTLSGEKYTVVGVMSPWFKYPRGAVSLWIPLVPVTSAASPASGPTVEAIGRLAPGVDLPTAQARANVVSQRIAVERKDVTSPYLLLTSAGKWRANPDMRRALLVLAGAVAFVMLIACGNAANLLLVQSSGRRTELRVRLALGASRSRIVRELLSEAALLSLASGVFGIVLAYWAVHAILAIAPSELIVLSNAPLQMDLRVLVVALGAALLTGTMVGLITALQATSGQSTLLAGERAATGTVAQRRVRSALVVGELALSLMLLVGAGLLMHSFARLLAVAPGMDTRHLALLDISPSPQRHPAGAARAAFYTQVADRIRALPGVQAVSVVRGTAGQSSFSFGVRLEAEGAAGPSAEQPELLPFGEADPEYFRTLGIAIRQGRAFTMADLEPTSTAVIVDEDLARQLWPDGGAVGRRFRLGAESPWLTVVGVAADVKFLGPDEREGRFAFYRPTPPTPGGQRTIAVRTSGDPRELLPALKEAVHAVDPLQPVITIETGQQRFRETLDKPRFLLVIMAVFASVAAVLAAVGLYGVISYAVSQRTREIGIRMALGAREGTIVGGVLRESAVVVGAGLVLGLVGTVALTRFLESLLFGVSPTDPTALIAVVAGLAAVAMLAAWIPARRASRVDPVVALRAE
jgi:putative ABC transport system permease protein